MYSVSPWILKEHYKYTLWHVATLWTAYMIWSPSTSSPHASSWRLECLNTFVISPTATQITCKPGFVNIWIHWSQGYCYYCWTLLHTFTCLLDFKLRTCPAMSSQEKGKGMFSQDCQNTTVSSRLKTSKDIFPWSWPVLISWVPGCSAYFGSPAMPSWQLLSARTPMLIELFVESGEAGLVSPSLASTQSHPKSIRRCWLTLIFAAHHICWKSTGKINDTDPQGSANQKPPKCLSELP